MELQKMTNGHHCTDLSPEKITLEDGFEGLENAEHEKFLPHKPDGQKVVQFTDFEGKTSFGMSVFNLSNAIMGSGILGLAFAMSNTGIVLFIILLTCIAVLSAYSIHLLLKSAGVVGIRAYEQLGNRAFGHPGKVVAACIITMHNIGAMSSYLFIVKSEFPLVIQALMGDSDNSGQWYLNGNYLIMIVSVLVILPLATMRQLGYLGYTSGFSLSCMVFFLISVIYKKFATECPLSMMDMHSTNTSLTNTTGLYMSSTVHSTAYASSTIHSTGYPSSTIHSTYPTTEFMAATEGPSPTVPHEITAITESLATVLPELQDIANNATDFLYALMNSTFSTIGDVSTTSDLSSTDAGITTMANYILGTTPEGDYPTAQKMVSHDDHSMADGPCEAKMFTINLQTAYTIPILAFAFVCHPEVLPIYTELRNPTKKRMQAIANISITAMFIMYLFTAIFGYLTFYTRVESELLHTYSNSDTLILCVRLAVLMAVTLTVPVVLFPIRRALQELLFSGKPFSWARHIIIAICLLFIVNVLVIFVPNITHIFGFIGATSAPSLIFILPGVFYLRIVPEEQEPMKSRPKIGAAMFAVLGVIFMVMSISFIILDWTSGESRSGGGH
ncbi:sodium-coupled neutral amino acid transporter 5-like isoform X3 [Clupea harengus]|uniref:Sodium-coupled neutral amino acid transporter 5-like isoform X2 n=1 Tax=Clupea harengus TaxID=7950 RepID=A0A6P8FBR8_CLUHA|nr:sodium-coupled neutral amino acid transporter 5-like isoform X2 [Clupea harengus]XP_031422850.1 sodium-coupled neutral amino acid transporter 5-like isoform X3 [Clupea harengus]